MCLSIGTPKTINFPFVPNGKLMVFRRLNIKHILVAGPSSTQDTSCTFSSFQFSYSESNTFKEPNLTLMHSERPKLYAILALLSAIGLHHFPLSSYQHFPFLPVVQPVLCISHWANDQLLKLGSCL